MTKKQINNPPPPLQDCEICDKEEASLYVCHIHGSYQSLLKANPIIKTLICI